MDKNAFYAEARDDVRGPLEGVTVLEMTTTWAGPMAGCILADMGALVTKVEHPAGEVGRLLPPHVPDSKLSLFNETVNRNKRSLSLDLRSAKGRDIFLELCAGADIVIENFRPGTLAGWGLGYADCARVKADIIYVSISAYGQFGELSDRVGYDPLAQNFCGWASQNGEPDGGPVKAPTYLADDLGGLNGAISAMGALLHRNRTGEGQHVDVALVDGLLFQSNGFLSAGALDIPIPRMGNEFSLAAPVNRYACEDGYVYAGVLLDSHWQALAKLLGKPDLAHLNGAERVARRDQLNAIVAGWCAERHTDAVVTAFSELGLPATRVNTYAECARHAHVAERDMLQSTTLSDGSVVPLTGPAAKFSRTPTRIRSAAPPLGADNASILRELGYDEAAVAALREDGVC